MELEKVQKIKDILFEKLDSIYCNNCRHKLSDDCCEDCNRKMMQWKISEEYSEQIALEIVKELDK